MSDSAAHHGGCMYLLFLAGFFEIAPVLLHGCDRPLTSVCLQIRLYTLKSTQERHPRGFWKSKTNQRHAFDHQIAPTLDIRSLDDWYLKTVDQVRKAGGSIILSYYKDSLAKCLKSLYAEHEWQEWRFVKSPQKYWKQAPESERLKFLQHLEQHLGVQRRTDWYTIQAAHLSTIPGARSFLSSLYGGSLITALESLYPDHEWLPWKFDNVSRKWWEAVPNRRKFLEFVGKEIGITRLDGWYLVSPQDVTIRGGYRLLDGYHHGNLAEALSVAFPEHDWQPWKFKNSRVPKGFWSIEANRRRFIEWLGSELNFKSLEDWTKLRRHDVISHGGSSLLEDYFDQSVHSILQFMFPRHKWNAWELDSGAPRNFWMDQTNHKRFLDFLKQKFQIDDNEKWYSVSVGDVILAGGGSFLAQYNNSLATALKALIPNHHWETSKLQAVQQRNPSIMAINEAIDAVRAPPEAFYILEPSDLSLDTDLAIWAHTLRECFPQFEWNDDVLGWRRSKNQEAFLGFLSLHLFGSPNVEKDQWISLTMEDLIAKFGRLAARKLAPELLEMLKSRYSSDNNQFYPWLVKIADDRVWKNKEIRHQFFHFAARQLRTVDEESDLDFWYSVSKAQLKKLGAGNLLKLFYGDSLFNALSEVYPTKKWLPWPFSSRGSAGYWDRRENIDLFISELKSKLSVRSMEDWYQLSVSDFLHLHGRRLIALHRNSPISFLQHVFPSHQWEAWRFKRQSRLHGVARNLSEESARHFADSLAKQLHIQHPEDWYRVSYAQMKAVGAWYSVDSLGGLPAMLARAYPNHNWDLSKLSLFGKKSHQRDLLRVVRHIFASEQVEEDHKHQTETGYVELDVYVPKLQLAFEYQGEYHYKDVLFIGETADRGDKDVTKASQCARAGITLISVPFWWDGSVESLQQVIAASRQDLAGAKRNASEKK